jgi:ribosomal subunit interface protein
MQLPLQVTFRDMPHSDAVQAHVERRAAKLDTFFDRIMSCRVVVEAPHRSHQHGKRYNVRIDVTVPGNELVIARNPPDNLKHEDMHAVIDDAFDDAERVIDEYAKRLRNGEKPRNGAPHGRVVKKMDGYGFLEGPDGYEIYFHRNSVMHGDFERLQVGQEVRYAEEMGEKGPQASTVSVVGKSH